MISGHGTAPTAVKAIKMGAYDYLEKPLAYNRVLEALTGALAASGTGEGAGQGALDLGRALSTCESFCSLLGLPLAS